MGVYLKILKIKAIFSTMYGIEWKNGQRFFNSDTIIYDINNQ